MTRSLIPFAAWLAISATLGVAQQRRYPPDAIVNVTAAPYLAVPDDGKDDTAALQQAISDHVDSGTSPSTPAAVIPA
ncbi:MAG: hypothetical protein WD042_12215 [Phycisphaeraceae bacterium]